MNSKWSGVLLLVVFVLGCTTSGVVQVGPDTYSISAYHDYSSTGAKGMAYEKANKFYSSRGKQLYTLSNSSRHERIAGIQTSNYDLDFRCLSAYDPELQRPNLVPVPDVVIETR